MLNYTFLIMFGVVLSTLPVPTAAATAEEWRTRIIYQVLTDRFAGGSGTSSFDGYMGGTWSAMADKLDYIQGIGADAVWISPIPANTPNGYHGYWLSDLYQVNSNFGSSQDLGALVQAMHAKGMYAMLDIVANHVGPVGTDFSGIVPFNSSEYYHSQCDVTTFECGNDNTLLCWLEKLPDLNQSHPVVRNALIQWIGNTVSKYSIDGLRIDTTLEVNREFWRDFVNAAGVYAVGEVGAEASCCAEYQASAMDATLDYPLFYALRGAFAQQESMDSALGNYLKARDSIYSDPGLLGTFVGNHDHPRFLNVQPDPVLLRNALACQMLLTGIPIFYYGDEQGFHGGNDPANREPMWPSSYSTSSPMYGWMRNVTALRRAGNNGQGPFTQRYSDSTFYAYTNGEMFVAVTNVGGGGADQTRTISYMDYADGTVLCDALSGYPCVTVQNGQFSVTLRGGEPMAAVPSQ